MSHRSIPAPPSVQISWGELLDKIAILEIKAQRLNSQAATEKISRELAVLSSTANDIISQQPYLLVLKQQLKSVNEGSLGYRRQNTGQGDSEILRSTIH